MVSTLSATLQALVLFGVTIFVATPAVGTPRLSTKTQAKAPAKSASNWSTGLTLSTARGHDELDETYGTGELSLSYQFMRDHTLFGETGYSQPMVAVDDDVDRYGMTDTSLGYSIANLFSYQKTFSVDGSLQVSLPTSEISRRASLISATSAGVKLSLILPAGFYLYSRHGGTFNAYRYETADEEGTRFNAPWMVSNSIGSGVRFWKATTNFEYGLHHLKDYSNTSINVQTFAFSIGFAINSFISASAYTQWRDRTLSDNALFATDTQVTGFSLTLTHQTQGQTL